ncbi:concanavalin A-like lectin/glucanase [Pleomassaria siparia CBS 279.74]|uniref:Concanavalin A-like lectin/glucanase n=1 Tax=Pleomassaria siparia CBS 279.74 TaxID=1314801 RepID=A0A6G1K9I2_9PLEO|nr:concanavalin A-like lectin/glucanase [Pleomassaria siparia CBS 279.74]
MHFTKFLSLVSLAVTAAALLLASGKVSLKWSTSLVLDRSLDGIDEGTNPNQIVIQAGFDAVKKQDGTVIYEAFYEWFPNPATFISADDFSASAGDTVSITVATSQSGITAGAAFVNQNTLQSINVEFYSPNEKFDARCANAQWVIERAPGTTLANFGQIKFTESAAAEANGFSHGVSGGTTIDFVVDGNTLATGAINGDSEVDITYTGP